MKQTTRNCYQKKQYRYFKKVDGKRKDVNYTIGTYPNLSLSQARTEQQILKSEVAQGVDVHKRKLDLRVIKPKEKKIKINAEQENWNIDKRR